MFNFVCLCVQAAAATQRINNEPELFTTARLRARFTDLFANLSQAGMCLYIIKNKNNKTNNIIIRKNKNKKE